MKYSGVTVAAPSGTKRIGIEAIPRVKLPMPTALSASMKEDGRGKGTLYLFLIIIVCCL